MMERKTRYEVQRICLLQNMKQRQYEIYYWSEDLELWYRDNQRNGTSPEKLNLRSDTRSIFYKVRTGRFWWVRSRKDFPYEKDLQKCKDRISHCKNKKLIDNSVRCIKRKFLRICKVKTMPQFENILYFQVHRSW